MTKMSLELEAEAVRLSEDGHTSREVVRLLGCSKSEVGNVLVRQAIRLLPHGPSQQNRRIRSAADCPHTFKGCGIRRRPAPAMWAMGGPPTEATVRTLSVLGHGHNCRDVTVVWWPGLPDVM